MIDWLKPILGDGYNEEIDNKIAAEINKGFVAKADYDAAKDAQRTAAEALADANKALAEYKDTDIDGLRKSAEEWQAKAEQAEKDADARVAAVQFDAKLDSAIAAAHGRSGKAIRALLDLDALRGSEDLLYDLIDEPDEIKRIVKEIHTAWFQIFDAINEVLQPVNPGYTDWDMLYYPGPGYILQSDL